MKFALVDEHGTLVGVHGRVCLPGSLDAAHRAWSCALGHGAAPLLERLWTSFSCKEFDWCKFFFWVFLILIYNI